MYAKDLNLQRTPYDLLLTVTTLPFFFLHAIQNSKSYLSRHRMDITCSARGTTFTGDVRLLG
jgi:hypothetical protein